MNFIDKLLLLIICFSIFSCKSNHFTDSNKEELSYNKENNIIKIKQGDKVKIVFVGAGVKGVSYFGFASTLSDSVRNNIVELYGSSIGSIPSALLALGLKRDEISYFQLTIIYYDFIQTP